MTDEISAIAEYYDDYYGDQPNYDPLLAEIDSFIGVGDLDEQLIQESQVTGRPLAECALKRGLNLHDPKWWDNPKDLNDDTDIGRPDMIGKYDQNIISRMSRAVARCVQFPEATTMLHACGVISTAMIRHFFYVRFGSKKPIGLYTAAAQPAGSGKSPTNDYLVGPIAAKIMNINDQNKPMMMAAAKDLARLKDEFTKNKIELKDRELADRILTKEHELAEASPYEYGYTDATPEALEEIAARQHGRFSIVTDEAEGVSVLVGANYNKPGAMPNLGLMLKGWDGGQQKSARIGRPGYSGRLYGAVAVLAQQSTVAAILRTGRSENGSRGACERFWLLDEKNILDKKDHDNFYPVPDDIAKEYAALAEAIVTQKFDVEFTFSKQSEDYLRSVIKSLHPHICDGGKWSDELMRGTISKADTQICKMASVLHAGKEYAPGGTRSKEIQLPEVMHATYMYMQMIKSFGAAAEDQNIGGEMPYLRAASQRMREFIRDLKQPKSQITFVEFCESIKNRKPFFGGKAHRKQCKDKWIHLLIDARHIIFDGKTGMIHINPKLKNM